MQLKHVFFAASLVVFSACQSGQEQAAQQDSTAVQAEPVQAVVETKVEEYPTRGQIVSIGQADAEGMVVITVDHEEIPNFMMAMRMGLKAPAADAAQLAAGDKIAFKMAQKESGMMLVGAEKLPADTQLTLRAQ